MGEDKPILTEQELADIVSNSIMQYSAKRVDDEVPAFVVDSARYISRGKVEKGELTVEFLERDEGYVVRTLMNELSFEERRITASEKLKTALECDEVILQYTCCEEDGCSQVSFESIEGINAVIASQTDTYPTSPVENPPVPDPDEGQVPGMPDEDALVPAPEPEKETVQMIPLTDVLLGYVAPEKRDDPHKKALAFTPLRATLKKKDPDFYDNLEMQGLSKILSIDDIWRIHDIIQNKSKSRATWQGGDYSPEEYPVPEDQRTEEPVLPPDLGELENTVEETYSPGEAILLGKIIRGYAPEGVDSGTQYHAHQQRVRIALQEAKIYDSLRIKPRRYGVKPAQLGNVHKILQNAGLEWRGPAEYGPESIDEVVDDKEPDSSDRNDDTTTAADFKERASPKTPPVPELKAEITSTEIYHRVDEALARGDIPLRAAVYTLLPCRFGDAGAKDLRAQMIEDGKELSDVVDVIGDAVLIPRENASDFYGMILTEYGNALRNIGAKNPEHQFDLRFTPFDVRDMIEIIQERVTGKRVPPDKVLKSVPKYSDFTRILDLITVIKSAYDHTVGSITEEIGEGKALGILKEHGVWNPKRVLDKNDLSSSGTCYKGRVIRVARLEKFRQNNPLMFYEFPKSLSPTAWSTIQAYKNAQRGNHHELNFHAPRLSNEGIKIVESELDVIAQDFNLYIPKNGDKYLLDATLDIAREKRLFSMAWKMGYLHDNPR